MAGASLRVNRLSGKSCARDAIAWTECDVNGINSERERSLGVTRRATAVVTAPKNG